MGPLAGVLVVVGASLEVAVEGEWWDGGGLTGDTSAVKDVTKLGEPGGVMAGISSSQCTPLCGGVTEGGCVICEGVTEGGCAICEGVGGEE